MKTKRKILAIFVILLLVAIPFSIAEASGGSQTEQKSEAISVELITCEEDGTYTTEKMQLSNEELTELENTISRIMDEIENTKDWDSLKNLIKKYSGEDNSLFGKILGIFTGIKIIKRRAFVVSSGHGIDFNPFNKISFKIKKTFGMWHYNSNGLRKARTIILKPLKLDMKILRGTQVGFMTRFVGVYLSVSRGFLQDSYTMFMGMTRHINGLQLSPS